MTHKSTLLLRQLVHPVSAPYNCKQIDIFSHNIIKPGNRLY